MKYKILTFIMLLFMAFSVNAEGEATIKNIKVNGVDCTCSGYDCKVEVDATSASITYEKVDSKATIDRLNGFRVDLLSQVTTIKIVVTNNEGTDKIENTYTINITKHQKNNDFSLKSLTVNGEKIELINEVIVYSYTSKYDADKIVIDAVANDSKAKIIKQKEYPFDLKDSSLAVDFSIEAENGERGSYRIVVTRGVKPNTTLKTLTVEPGNIDFKEDVYEYNFSVEYGTNEIKVDAVANSKTAKVEITNKPLVVGENKIVVTVTNEKSKSEYVLLVTREENIDKSIANLKSLKVSEYPKLDFKENVLDYELSFDKIPEKLHVEAKAKDADGKVEILNNEDLKEGSKVIVKVTLEEEKISREYTLKLVKEKEEAHNNKTVILISIIMLVITIIVLLALEIHNKKCEKRNYLKKIFELRHRRERKRKEEKNKKLKEEEIEII